MEGIGVVGGKLDTLVEPPNGMSIGGPQPTAGTDLEGLLGNKDTILLDTLRREVVMHSGKKRKIHLTNVEFYLLEYLMRHPGRVVSHQEIDQKAFRYGRYYEDLPHIIGVYVSNLRRKIGDNARSPVYIKTVRGKGYMFVGAQNKG